METTQRQKLKQKETRLKKIEEEYQKGINQSIN